MKSYLIIGASSGIGKSLAENLVKEGHQVFGAYLTNEIASKDIQYQRFDALEDDLDLNMLPEVLDGMAYCPGSLNLMPFARIKAADFAADYQLQVIGAVKVIQAVLPRLKKAEQSSLILFSTVAVQTGFNFHSQVSASKGAIEGLTRALAAEFAPKVRVNCIAPSLTETPLVGRLLNNEKKIETNAVRHPLKRIGQPEDIAHMASFLFSDKSNWITGQIMHVDGGMSRIKG